MKFKTSQTEIVKIINSCTKIAVKNNLNPLFECVLLELQDHNLIIRVTNLEIVFEKNIKVLGEINGKVLINIEVFNKIIQNINQNKDNTLEFELMNNTLIIKNEDTEVELDIFSNTEYLPNIPKNKELLFNINSKIFTNLIKSVNFSANL